MITFNPIKVLFLQKGEGRPITEASGFQSYQGSIFTKYTFLAWTQAPASFNPIKVLFLLSNHGRTSKQHSNFQSYQGSIFTSNDPKLARYLYNFQSYQGSIFTVAGVEGMGFCTKTFNPIKVLFLPLRGVKK